MFLIRAPCIDGIYFLLRKSLDGPFQDRWYYLSDAKAPRSVNMGQTRKRSLIKAASWRAIASLTGAAIVVVLTGEMEHGGAFLAADASLKMVFYYLHERGWEAVTWGVLAD